MAGKEREGTERVSEAKTELTKRNRRESGENEEKYKKPTKETGKR